MQLTLIAKVDVIARRELRLPDQYIVRPMECDDWTQLIAIYFTAYPREIIESLAVAEDEMQRTRSGEYGILADELSPVATTINNTVVGAVMTVWQAPWPKTPKGLFIIEVFTHPQHRRLGLAKAGLIWLARKAQEKEFDTLSLRVETENQAAVSLYRSLGFADWQEIFGNRLLIL